MFGFSLSKQLRGLDFYRVAPSEYAQGTVSGACISIVSISALVILSFSAISSFMTPQIYSDIIVDAKHSQDKLRVNIDIEFPYFSCALLSLDLENVLKLHLVNHVANLTKYTFPDNQPFNNEGKGNRERFEEDLKNGVGCRVAGFFEIDRVPGNFHFSGHGYMHQISELIRSGRRQFDLSHKINHLYFGEEPPKSKIENTLRKFRSEKQIPEEFLGITYAYFLEIVEKNTVYSNGYVKETFFYTVRINQLLLASVPMVMFSFSTNPLTELEVGEYSSWDSLFIELVAIIGGIFTVSSIIDQLVHSSIRYLLEKNQMGKLI